MHECRVQGAECRGKAGLIFLSCQLIADNFIQLL